MHQTLVKINTGNVLCGTFNLGHKASTSFHISFSKNVELDSERAAKCPSKTLRKNLFKNTQC